MSNPNLFCPECGVYFTKHFVESPTCNFSFVQNDDLQEFGWEPKDQSARGVASRTDKSVFGLYRQ